MKLLLDMNLSPRWIDFLRDEGWEAVNWSHGGQATARDDEIMAYAVANDAVVVTHDLDFGAILNYARKKPSVVQIRAEDLSPERIGKQVVVALRHAKKWRPRDNRG
jgi:predicted nuclease of predicted toxin-antitoxin system